MRSRFLLLVVVSLALVALMGGTAFADTAADNAQCLTCHGPGGGVSLQVDFGVGTVDLLLDEDLTYADRLRDAGVPCTVDVIDGLKSRQVGALALDVYEEEAELFFEECLVESLAAH